MLNILRACADWRVIATLVAVGAGVALFAPNLIGANTKGLDARVSRVVPGYMTMGDTGMGEMMMMPMPRNSISMLGGDGPFGTIDMGGMFTIVKTRKQLTGDSDPGWYDHPKGEVASLATADEIARDGIKI